MNNTQEIVEGDIDDEIAELRFQALLTKTENEAEVSSAYEPLSNRNNVSHISLNQPLSQFHGSNQHLQQSFHFRGHSRGRKKYKPYLETFSQQMASNSVNSSNIVVLTTTGPTEPLDQNYSHRGRWPHGRGQRGRGRGQYGSGGGHYNNSGLISGPSSISQKPSSQLVLPQDKYSASSKPLIDNSEGNKTKLSARMRRLQGSGSDSEDSESDSSEESSSNSSSSDSSSSSSESSSTGSDSESDSDNINELSKKLMNNTDNISLSSTNLEKSITEKSLDQNRGSITSAISAASIADNNKKHGNCTSNSELLHLQKSKTATAVKSNDDHISNSSKVSPISPNFDPARSPYRYRSPSPKYTKKLSPYSPKRRTPTRRSMSKSPSRFIRRRSPSPLSLFKSKSPVRVTHSPIRRFGSRSPLSRGRISSPFSRKSMSPYSRYKANKCFSRSPRFRSRSPLPPKRQSSRSPLNHRYRSRSPRPYRYFSSKSPSPGRRRYLSKSPDRLKPLRNRSSRSLTPQRFRHSPLGSRSPIRRRIVPTSPRKFDRMSSPSREISPQTIRRVGSKSPRQTMYSKLSPFSREYTRLSRSPEGRRKYRSAYSRSPNRLWSKRRSQSPYMGHQENIFHGTISTDRPLDLINKLDSTSLTSSKQLSPYKDVSSLSPRMNRQNRDNHSHTWSPAAAHYPDKFGADFSDYSRPNGQRPPLLITPNFVNSGLAPNLNFPPPRPNLQQPPPPRPLFQCPPSQYHQPQSFNSGPMFESRNTRGFGRNVHGRISRGGLSSRAREDFVHCDDYVIDKHSDDLNALLPHYPSSVEHNSNSSYRGPPPNNPMYLQSSHSVFNSRKLQGPKTPPDSPKREPSPVEWQKRHNKIVETGTPHENSIGRHDQNVRHRSPVKEYLAGDKQSLFRNCLIDEKSPMEKHIRSLHRNKQGEARSPPKYQRHETKSPFRYSHGEVRSPLVKRQGDYRLPLNDRQRDARSPIKVCPKDNRSPIKTKSRNTRSPIKDRARTEKSPVKDRLRDARSPVRDRPRDAKSPIRDRARSPIRYRARDARSPMKDRSRDVRSPIRPRDAKSPVRDRPRDAKSPVRDRPRDAKSPVRDRPRDAKSPVRDRPRDAKSPVRDRPRDAKSPVRDRPRDAKSPVRDRPRDARSPVRDRPRDARSPVKDRSRDVRSPIKDRSRDARSPVKDRPRDVRSPVKDRPRDTRSPIKDRPRDARSPAKCRSKDKRSPGKDRARDKRSPGKARSRDNRSPIKDRPRDNRSPIKERPRDIKSPMKDKTRSGRSPVKDTLKDIRSPLKDQRRDSRSPIKIRQRDTRSSSKRLKDEMSPSKVCQNDMRLSHRDPLKEERSSYKEHPKNMIESREYQKDLKSLKQYPRDDSSPYNGHQRDGNISARPHRNTKSPIVGDQIDAKYSPTSHERNVKSSFIKNKGEEKAQHKVKSSFREPQRDERRFDTAFSKVSVKSNDRSANKHHSSPARTANDHIKAKFRDHASSHGVSYFKKLDNYKSQEIKENESDRFPRNSSKESNQYKKEDSKRSQQKLEKSDRDIFGNREAENEDLTSTKSPHITKETNRLTDHTHFLPIKPEIKIENVDVESNQRNHINYKNEESLRKQNDFNKIKNVSDAVANEVLKTSTEKKSSNITENLENKIIPINETLIDESVLQINSKSSLDSSLEEYLDEGKDLEKDRSKRKLSKIKKNKDADNKKKKKKKHKNVEEKKSHKKKKKKDSKKKHRHSDKNSISDPKNQICIRYENSGDRTVSVKGVNDLRNTLSKREKRARSSSKMDDERHSKMLRTSDIDDGLTSSAYNYQMSSSFTNTGFDDSMDNNYHFRYPINLERREESSRNTRDLQQDRIRERRSKKDSEYFNVTVDKKDRKVTHQFNKNKKKRKSEGPLNVSNRGGRGVNQGVAAGRPSESKLQVHLRLNDKRSDKNRGGGARVRKRDESNRWAGGSGRNDGRRRGGFARSNR